MAHGYLVMNQVNMHYWQFNVKETVVISCPQDTDMVLALHTDLINVLMAPCLLANEQLMRSSPAVLKSTHSEIATVMIISSILHEFGCNRICSTPCIPVSLSLVLNHDASGGILVQEEFVFVVFLFPAMSLAL